MPVPQAARQATIAEHDLEAALKDATGKARGYGTQLKSIKCQSCGAVLNVEPNITSTKCSFCGSNQVLEQQVDSDLYRPESLLPFAIDDIRSNNLFRDWLGRGLFTPNDLKREGGGQKLRGVYLPFWTFDAHAESDWRAESGDYYYETEWVTVTRDGRPVDAVAQITKMGFLFVFDRVTGEPVYGIEERPVPPANVGACDHGGRELGTCGRLAVAAEGEIVFGIEPVLELTAAAPESVRVLYVRAGAERRFGPG